VLQTEIAEEIKTHILSQENFFFFFENRAVYGLMWKNMVEEDRPHENMAHAHSVLDN